jgi:integrase
MIKKCHLNLFSGKLIWVSVFGSGGIRRRYAWNEARSRYEDPPNGPLYEARRQERHSSKRTSKTFPLLQLAREWKERRVEETVMYAPILAEANVYSIAQLIDDFRKKRFSDLSEGTIIIYERVFKSFGPLLQRNVDSIEPKDIAAWIDWLKSSEQIVQRRKTRISFEKELDALSAILHWHIEEDDKSRLIFPIKRKHYLRAQVHKRVARRVVLSEEELSAWFAALQTGNPLYYSLAFVQLSQALRVSEVCAMKWSNLDLANRRYEIREHVIWPRVGGRPAKLLPGTKSDSETAYWIPLWEDVQLQLVKLAKIRTSDLIFTKNGSLLTYREVQAAYNRAFKIAKLPHRSTHVCRHTGATLFLDKTDDLSALQQLGGWTNQKMPQHYAEILAKRADKAMRESERKLKLIKGEKACS